MTTNPANQQAEHTQYYRRVLHDLIDMGANIAKTLHDQITAPTNGHDLIEGGKPEATIAFDRIARAVRRTILLAQKIAEPPRATAEAPDAASTRRAARKQILRSIENTIHESASHGDAAALHAELRDRLDAPELAEHLDEEMLHRPIANIIEDIRRDLGLAEHHSPRGWKRRRPADIAALNARAANPAPRPQSPPAGPARPEHPTPAIGPPRYASG